MPTPVNDAAAALHLNQTKTEQALRKVRSTFIHIFASLSCTFFISAYDYISISILC